MQPASYESLRKIKSLRWANVEEVRLYRVRLREENEFIRTDYYLIRHLWTRKRIVGECRENNIFKMEWQNRIP